MIKISDGLWVGIAVEPGYGNLKALEISAILNTAQDLQGTVGWSNGIEYMQVGLIDGPGNPISAYYANVLSLAALISRHRNVLVCSHEGGRSLAIAIMYLQTTIFEYSWDKWNSILRERIDIDLPVPHQAHGEAFGKINWQMLRGAIGG